MIFELFNGVVGRFEERIRFDNLAGVRFDSKDATEIVERMAGLSRHIEGHLHSDAFRPVKPTPELLLAEIEAFERVRERLKALKKPQAQPKPGPTAAPPSADGKG